MEITELELEFMELYNVKAIKYENHIFYKDRSTREVGF